MLASVALTCSNISIVASSQPSTGSLRCDSKDLTKLHLAVNACCPCWTYAADTSPLAKAQLAAFMLMRTSQPNCVLSAGEVISTVAVAIMIERLSKDVLIVLFQV